jgi:hypothetical protein
MARNLNSQLRMLRRRLKAEKLASDHDAGRRGHVQIGRDRRALDPFLTPDLREAP